jgi:predicted transcriptional regulator
VNVVAVAELLNLAAVIITEGARPNDETLARAVEKNIPLLMAQEGTFGVVGKMYGLGIAGSQ